VRISAVKMSGAEAVYCIFIKMEGMTSHSYLYSSFNQWVRKKYNIYNSIFLSLPFEDISRTGTLLPVMNDILGAGLSNGVDPIGILDDYFRKHTNIKDEHKKIDFMFRIIQYIERQIVLYDSIEDSAFPHLLDTTQQMSILDFIHLGKSNDNTGRILESLNTFGIRLVLTAHPTQFYPPSVLDIIGSLKRQVDDNDLNGIDLSLQQLGMTSLLKSKKPTPFEEAKNIIYYLRHVYYDAVGEFYAGIKKNFEEGAFNNPGLVRIGFWPGGDRDGNPFVTADTTSRVADELRTSLMKCYYNDIKLLEKKMTFRKVEDIISQLRDALYECMFDPQMTIGYHDILKDLLHIRELIITNYNRLYLEELDALIDKVNIFRTHFACLDIRQNHDIHKNAIEIFLLNQNIIAQNIEELQENDLLHILLNSEFSIDPELYKEDVIKETILNIMQLKDIQLKNGEPGCNRYIISNAEDIYSVLFVYALFRWCGWEHDDLSFDIIPLFETMHGMDQAALVMDKLFNISQYKEHLDRRGNVQTIMLGYSDGTKDGGYLKANWSIFKTKEALTDVCKRHDVKVIFFDGRGGPPARGGGKSHRFYAAQSDLIANNEIQLTIQGQTITSRFGTTDQFIHNCDQLLTAGLSRHFMGKDHRISPTSRALIDELSDISYKKYQALKNHPKFLSYLEKKSTLKYYSEANIGSRPAKRGNKERLELKDLRAIPFVGSWSQLKQNVPGYYGFGTALKRIAEDGRSEELKRLFKEVPYFKALVLNSMMSIYKCNFQLTAYLKNDEHYAEFWDLLFKEYTSTKTMLLSISGYNDLMEEEPVTRSSVEIREQIVLPLLLIQQYAMQKVEQGSGLNSNYEKIITRSLYGIINASRNSV